MKYKLINKPDPKLNATQQILLNRGIPLSDHRTYLNLTDDVINEPEMLGKEILEAAAKTLNDTIKNFEEILIVVDCDCDGYTSAALICNYIYDMNNDYSESHLSFFLHEGKQHGLADAIDFINNINPKLIIIPDAGSNDIEYLSQLYFNNIKVIIMDHHEIEFTPEVYSKIADKCFLLNSQYPWYPNKELSGVGVTYQFCRYMDKINQTDYADWYLDLVALGNTGDMMSLKSFETRRLITKGLEQDNIHNPFIFEMWQKNKFKLGEKLTSWGVTFYIVPFVNAITRSGTIDEKILIFSSMLKYKAFKEILSNKRGHKLNEMERLVDQAVRTCTNVKNRQSRAEEAGLELVEHLIKDNNMMDHKVLLFLLEPGQIQAEIRGLIANKIMAKYQRPCCMLTKVIKEDGRVSYEGSARGCDKVGVTEFKDICAATHACDYTVGHQGAFGLGITMGKRDEFEGEVYGENLLQFIDVTDEKLKNMSSEPIYYVDYIWRANEVDPQAILDIGGLATYWGKDMDEALVAIQDLQITKDMLTMMASNTVKITLPNGVNAIKFRMPDEEYKKLYSENGYVEVNLIARCNINEWNGNRYPQLLIDDYEIIGKCAYIF